MPFIRHHEVLNLRGKMNKQIKAMFREEARRIVSNDRSARKYGVSNNLPGDITNALVTAYKLGLEHGGNPDAFKPELSSNDASVAWELVPPTSRTILRYLTFNYSNRGAKATFVPSELRAYSDPETGRQRWAWVDQGDKIKGDEHSFAAKGVGPLRRMELLAPKDADENHLILTSKGDATCRLYWDRSDRNDPTLPIQSMRG